MFRNNKKIFIKVLSKKAIEQFKTNENHIVISVSSPESEKARLPDQKSRLDAIFLKFHDLDGKCKKIMDKENCKICNGTGYIEEYKDISNGRCFNCNPPYKDKIILFATNMAELIWSFVDKYKDKTKLILVNCEAGISRSAGIAGALSKLLEGEDDFYFNSYYPNRLVYRTMLKVGINRKQRREKDGTI